MAYTAQVPVTSRATGIALVVTLHLVVIWALVTVLSRTAAPIIFNPFKTTILEEIKTDDTPPPPPTPEMDIPELPFVPPPDFNFDTAASSNAITATDILAPRPDPKHPMTKPEYPAQSKRLGEEGSVTLALFVDVDGRVKEAKIDKSSGYPLLDNAALQHALRNFRFLPGSKQGVPVAVWHKFKVTFKITG